MRPIVACIVISLSLGALPRPAGAQQALPDSTLLAEAVRTLKGELRSYVTAQEQYYVEHRTYALNAPATPLEPSRGVAVILLTSAGTGHSAVAIHRDVPGLVCGIWVGLTPRPPLDDGAREGEPTCRLP